MSTHIRTVALAVRDWIVNPVTMAASLLVAAACAVSLFVDPPRGEVGPPAEVTVAKVGGYCATIVVGSDGSVWALAPGAVDGKLKRVDPGDVQRDAAECER